MAERRMFSKAVTRSDQFVDMPLSAQALYFHLGMEADDDGFLSNPKVVQRMINASEDDLKLLFAKGFLLNLGENGICVIRHWRQNNEIKKDRYKPTVFLREKEMVVLERNKVYRLLDTACIQIGSKVDPQYSIGKDSILSCSSGDERAPEKEKEKQDQSALEANFNAIYKIYPRKKDKAKAFKAYRAFVGPGKKINGKNYRLSNSQIWEAVSAFVEDCHKNGTEPDFIPYAGTFFNGRILDYLPEGGADHE